MSGQAVMARICAICIVGFYICFSSLRGDEVEKCKDFYSHACKDMKQPGFHRRNGEHDREKYVARVDKLKTSKDGPFYSYYQSCLKREGTELFLKAKMREIILRTFKGNKLNEEDVAKMLDETATLDNTFFEFGYEHVDKNKFVIAGRPWLLQSEVDENLAIYEKYKKFVKDLFSDLDSVYEENEWKNVLKLEQEIIKAVNKHKGGNSYHFNHGKLFYYPGKMEESYTMTQLSEELSKSKGASKFNLTKFLQYFNDRILSGIVHSKVVFMGLPYFKELQKILSGYQKHIIARYILLKSTINLYYTLPKRFQEMPSSDIAEKLYLLSWVELDDSLCESETKMNLKYLEEQYYMDISFSGRPGIMADTLYKNIKSNWEKKLLGDHCMSGDKTSEIMKKMKDISAHMGRFELPYFQYKKTSFYNGSYFENVLASKRDFIQKISEGEEGFGLENLTSSQRSRKISYYDKLNNTLYIFSYVFKTKTEHTSEFYGAAGPHVVEALFNAFNKEDFKKCFDKKQKRKVISTPRENPEEYFLETQLNLSVEAYEKSEPPKNDEETKKFFFSFAQEFCGADDEGRARLNKVLSSSQQFRTAFKCS